MKRFALSFVVWLAAVTAVAQSTTFIDATDPPAGLTACDPTDENSDRDNLQSIVDYIATSGQQAVLFLPPAKSGATAGGYIIDLAGGDSALTIKNIDGLRILGGGQGRSGKTSGATVNAYTKIICKGATGPAVIFDDVGGLVCSGVTFEEHTDSTLDILVKHINGSGPSGSLNLRFSDCGFLYANTLFYNGDGAGSTNAANIIFDNCSFKGEHSNASAERYAFYASSPQNLAFTFMHCYFLQCGTIWRFEEGGRLNAYGCVANNCAQLVHKEAGGQNAAGFAIRDLYIDGGGTKRTVWLKTNGTGASYGPMIFENIIVPSNNPSDGTNFAEISSWPGTTLNLGGALDMRPGDRIKFYDENDHNTVLAETTVVTRQSVDTDDGTAVYTVSDTCCDLPGLPSDLMTVDAAHGESLFELSGGESIRVNNCWFRNASIQGERLLTLRYSSFGGGRPSYAIFDQCMGFSSATAAGELYSKYVDDLSGGDPSYYEFRDCHKNGDGVYSTSNFP